MLKYRFDQIAINSTVKKKPVEEDKYSYIGLEHLDSENLIVSRWGSEVAPKGEKLLMKKGDMTERASGELLDQALCAVHSESYHVRNAALLAIRKYMQHNEEHAFRVCRMVEGMADSTVEAEQMLYNMVKEEVENK